MSNGLFIAADGKTISDERTRLYDSSKQHLQIDTLNKSPKLFDIVTMPAGHAILVTPGAEVSEDIFTITHNLGYVPTVWLYYFIYQNGASPDSGQYSTGTYIFGGSTVSDALKYELTDTTLRIVHDVKNISVPGSYTSTASNYTLRLKYYIFSNPASNTFVDIGNRNIIIF